MNFSAEEGITPIMDETVMIYKWQYDLMIQQAELATELMDRAAEEILRLLTTQDVQWNDGYEVGYRQGLLDS